MTGFAAALDRHLRTIKERDLDAFLDTVHPDATVILPNGVILSGRDEITEFHRGWFADTDWSFEPRELRVDARPDSGFAVLEVDYRDVDPTGSPYQKTYLLTLVFTLSDGRWLLVHDQNTFR